MYVDIFIITHNNEYWMMHIKQNHGIEIFLVGYPNDHNIELRCVMKRDISRIEVYLTQDSRITFLSKVLNSNMKTYFLWDSI